MFQITLHKTQLMECKAERNKKHIKVFTPYDIILCLALFRKGVSISLQLSKNRKCQHNVSSSLNYIYSNGTNYIYNLKLNN